jgi:hypothetical protein
MWHAYMYYPAHGRLYPYSLNSFVHGDEAAIGIHMAVLGIRLRIVFAKYEAAGRVT